MTKPPEPDWGSEPTDLALCADLPEPDVRAMLSAAWRINP